MRIQYLNNKLFVIIIVCLTMFPSKCDDAQDAVLLKATLIKWPPMQLIH